jgi:hypothetical protein
MTAGERRFVLCAVLALMLVAPASASAAERLRIAWANPQDHAPIVVATPENGPLFQYSCLAPNPIPGCKDAPLGVHWDDSDPHSLVLVDDNPSANRCYRFGLRQSVSGESPYPITATVTDVDGTRRSEALTLPSNTDSNRGDTDLGASPASSAVAGGSCHIAVAPKPADVRIEIERLGSGKLRVGDTVRFEVRAYNDGPGAVDHFLVDPNGVHGFEKVKFDAGPHPCPHGCQIADNLGKSPFHVSITAVVKARSTERSLGVRVLSTLDDPNEKNNFAFVRFACSTTLTLKAQAVVGPAVAKRLRFADVYIGKRRVKRLRGAAVRRSFTLRRLSGSRAKVRIVGRTRDGKTVRRTKTLKLCS